MVTEFVIVEYPTRRLVKIDNIPQGFNKNNDGKYLTKSMETGKYTFTLGGPDNYEPASQIVDVTDTSVIRPQRVVFAPKEASDG
jgi:hypothetical protein